MTKNNENIAKIDIKGFYDLCNRLKNLEEENQQLQANNQLMADELTYFKEYCADLENIVNNLPKKYIHQIDESRIIPNIEILMESLIDLSGFTVYQIAGYNDEFEGYLMQLKEDDFLNTEIAVETHENELVSAIDSYMEEY